MEIKFGKHRGRTVDWVWRNDNGYANWVLGTQSENAWFNEVKTQFVRLKQQEDIFGGHSPHDRFDPFEDLKRKYEEMKRQGQQRSQYRPPPAQPQAGKHWTEVLGVKTNDSVATIKGAYRQLIKKWHPDLCRDPKATEMTQTINAAYAAAMKGR